jgi:hypothetical protein
MRDRRLPVSLAATSILAVVLVLGLASSGAVVTPVHAASQTPSTPTTSPQASPTNQSPSHTLVIIQQNGSVGYTVTVSGTLSLQHRESGDSIAGQTATGQVGGFPWQETSNDSRDVIHFTGELQDFEYNAGQLRVMLDGKRIDPGSLRNTPAHTPTPMQTPTQTASPTQTSRTTPASSPSPAPTAATPTATHPPTVTTPPPTTDGGSPADTGSAGLLDQLVPVITGLAALGAVLYLMYSN